VKGAHSDSNVIMHRTNTIVTPSRKRTIQMTEIWLSVGISAILVIVEAVGISFSKWTVAKRLTEKTNFTAIADAIIAKQTSSPSPIDAVELQRIIANAVDNNRKETLGNLLRSVSPGPEVCFLALTMHTSIFLVFNYANDASRKIISPVLAGNQDSAFPIMLGLLFITAVCWLVALGWREAITLGLQKKRTTVSIFIITALGGSTLASAIYILLAGRL
jgi:hypothetical protein